MDRFFAVLALFVFTAVSQGDEAALRLANILQGNQKASSPVRTTPNCGCAYGLPCVCESPCTCSFPDYAIASSRCAAERKPLVVFCNVKPRPVAGLSICTATMCFDDASPRILVAMPGNGWLDWRADLPASVSDDAIKAVVFSNLTQSTPTYRAATPTYPLITPSRPQFAMRPMFFGGGGFSGGGRGGSC